MKTAFLVMEWVYKDEQPHLEINGIFSTKEKAVKECLTDHHFYGEIEIDKACHKKGAKWPTENPFPIPPREPVQRPIESNLI